MLVLAYPGNEGMARAIASRLGTDVGSVEIREFPDGETLPRVLSDVEDRDVVIVATMRRPNRIALPLLLLAGTIADLGARRVGLIAPYLAYLRQDTRFQPGEGISARYFASVLSQAFDWLVSVDPHLHRFRRLEDLYTIPAAVAHAAPAIGAYVAREVPNAVIIGPDSESKQWAADVAVAASVPLLVLRKQRHGDRDVSVSLPDIETLAGRTPVIVDDIVSSGMTMIRAAEGLREAGSPAPVCIGIHALLGATEERALRDAGIARLATCNTVEHPSNRIDVTDAIVEAVRSLGGR